MNFGQTILELRKMKNVTQEELAAELGVTAAAVSKWENNYTLPDILMLSALADYFDVTTDELLGRAAEKKYAIIAAETPELGEKIKTIAKEHGIIARNIYTTYQEALTAILADTGRSVQYLVVGFHNGGYFDECPIPKLVSVYPTDQEILEGFCRVFEKYGR